MAALVRLMFELAVTIGGSAFAWYVFGTRLYALVGVLMILIMFGLVTASRTLSKTQPNYDPLLEDHATPLWIRVLLVVIWALLIGLCWPVLPVVIAWRRVNERVGDASSPTNNERP